MTPRTRTLALALALAVVSAPSVASAAPVEPLALEGSQGALIRAQAVGALFGDRRAAAAAVDLVVNEYGTVYSDEPLSRSAGSPAMGVEVPAPAVEVPVEVPVEEMDFQMASPEVVEDSPVVEVQTGKPSTTHVRGVTPNAPVYRAPGAASQVKTYGGGARSAALAELSHYGNGRVPAEALLPIGQGSHRLWGPAAAAFQAMAAHAAADGIDLRVTDSYRSYEIQVDLVRRKGLYSQGGLAAFPGTSSHGWGLAVDVDTAGGAYEWLDRNAGTYGFVEDTPREPWHWGYHG